MYLVQKTLGPCHGIFTGHMQSFSFKKNVARAEIVPVHFSKSNIELYQIPNDLEGQNHDTPLVQFIYL